MDKLTVLEFDYLETILDQGTDAVGEDSDTDSEVLESLLMKLWSLKPEGWTQPLWTIKKNNK